MQYFTHLLVGFDGVDGSGKSTTARMLGEDIFMQTGIRPVVMPGVNLSSEDSTLQLYRDLGLEEVLRKSLELAEMRHDSTAIQYAYATIAKYNNSVAQKLLLMNIPVIMDSTNLRMLHLTTTIRN